MFKSLGMGVGILILISLLSLPYDVNFLMKYTGIIGLVFFFLSAVFSGSMGSGDRIRANYSNEAAEDTRRRFKLMNRLFLIGLPNVVVAALLYFWLYIYHAK